MVKHYDERGITEWKRVSLEQWFPDSRQDESYAVFGGDIFQRDVAVEQGIARCFGHRAILVIHNNFSLETELKNLISTYPGLERYQNNPMVFVNYDNQNYMPLWGVKEERLLEILYPETNQSHFSQYRSGVRSYLNILKYQNKPYTLPNLLRLCEKSVEQLEQEDLSSMSADLADEIMVNLVTDDVMMRLRNDIQAFAGQFRGRIWDGRESNVVNMLAAVKKQALISIQLPVASQPILDYLAMELEMILERGVPCLLVIDSVDIADSRMKHILSNPSMNMAKLIAGNTVQDVCSTVKNGGELLHRFQKILLFKCANPVIARQYSDMIGSYFKTVVSETVNNSKRLFSWMPVRTKGSTTSQQQVSRMEPEELANLGNGAVLINQETGQIEKTAQIEETV